MNALPQSRPKPPPNATPYDFTDFAVDTLLDEHLKQRSPRGEQRRPSRSFMQLALLKAYFIRRELFESRNHNLMISIRSSITGAHVGTHGTVLGLKNVLHQEMQIRNKRKALAVLNALLTVWASFRMAPDSVDELTSFRNKVAGLPEDIGDANYTLEREFWQALHAMSSS